MNISMQFVRGVAALTLCAAVSAFALTEPATASDEHEVAVAHSRLTIETVRDVDSQPRYQVASVRVGEPVAAPADQLGHVQARRVAQHATPVSDIHG
jgi:hypothetical protein